MSLVVKNQFWISALKPVALTAASNSSTVTRFPFNVRMALSGSETFTLVTPDILLSAPCTLATQAPQVIPLTTNLISVVASTTLSFSLTTSTFSVTFIPVNAESSGTGINSSINSPEFGLNIRT